MIHRISMHRMHRTSQARVAQSVEHWSNKPTVAGSIPVMSTINYFYPNGKIFQTGMEHV